MRKFTCFTLGLLLACAVTVNAQEQKNDQKVTIYGYQTPSDNKC